MVRIRGKIVTAAMAAVVLTVSAVVGMGVGGLTPARATQAQSFCTSAKHPKLAANISSGITAALAGRKDSSVGLTADDPAEDLSCAFHRTWHFYAASVIKVTILSALLRKIHGPGSLTAKQRHLAYLMITQSNNNAATALWDYVGMTDMQAFLNSAKMRHTILSDAWGLTQITAQDELTLLHVLTISNKVLSKASRRYVLRLMAEVITSERWGVSARPLTSPSTSRTAGCHIRRLTTGASTASARLPERISAIRSWS